MKRPVQYTMIRPSYVWSVHKTFEAARDSLDQDFACGTVDACEVEDIVKVKTANGIRYEVRLLME